MALFCDLRRVPVGRVGDRRSASPLVSASSSASSSARRRGARSIRPVSKKSPFAVFIVTIGLFQFLNWLVRRDLGRSAPAEQRRRQRRSRPSRRCSRTADDDFVTIFGAELAIEVRSACSSSSWCSPAVLFLRVQQDQARPGDEGRGEQRRERQAGRHPHQPCPDARAGASRRPSARRRRRVRRHQQQRQPRADVHGVHLRLGGGDARRVRQPGAARSSAVSPSASSRTWPPGTPKNWIGQELKLGVAFLIIVVVLLVKPSGLFGTAKVERV